MIANRAEAYLLGGAAEAYGVRPSALLGITAPGLALDFDLTIFSWVREVEVDLSRATTPAERRRRFAALMNGETGHITTLAGLRAALGNRAGSA